MRVRADGNIYNEVHGQGLRSHEWIAPPGSDPHRIVEALETSTGLALHVKDGRTTVDGYVMTSLRPDGSLFVAVVLYDFDCQFDCSHHPGINFRKAGTITETMKGQMVAATGEHPEYKLRGDDAADAEVLSALGFKEEDPAHRIVTVAETDVTVDGGPVPEPPVFADVSGVVAKPPEEVVTAVEVGSLV